MYGINIIYIVVIYSFFLTIRYIFHYSVILSKVE